RHGRRALRAGAEGPAGDAGHAVRGGMSPAPSPFQELVGEHTSMVALRQLVVRVARSKASTVLLYGETGTGKGLVARLIHQHSARAAHPFADINCAAIPGELLESELFGHERGAFTGAVTKKEGLIEAASSAGASNDAVARAIAVPLAE